MVEDAMSSSLPTAFAWLTIFASSVEISLAIPVDGGSRGVLSVVVEVGVGLIR